MSDLPLITAFFSVTIDGVDLGDWTEVSGIAMTIEADKKLDSAVNFMQNHLPGPLSYEPIVLSRIPNSYTAKTMAWFSSYHTLPVPLTAQIRGLDQQQNTVMSWDLIGVSPFKWNGPSFKIGDTSHALERLTLNHWGFI